MCIMRPYDQLRLFAGHLSWVRREPLVDFATFVGEFLLSNPNIPPRRVDRIVERVQKNVDDLLFVAHAG